MNAHVDLKTYRKGGYDPGNLLKRIVWYCVNQIAFCSPVPFPSTLKRFLLIFFGCKVGNCVIKPRVNIKYPWFLEIGENVWIGEGVWIDNLAKVTIGNNVCLSQDTIILTGNHDYSKTSFDLMVKEIDIKDGVWVGARAVVCPGSVLESHCVLNTGTVFCGRAEPYTVYKGNPAVAVKKRVVESYEN
jgi:putative colanic acid biosynthesis acetyltransferase WcaF